MRRSLPLLLRNTARLPQPPDDLETLLGAGEQKLLAADCWADLLYEAVAAEGGAMSGLRSADRENRSYVRLYNLLAQAAYDGAAVNTPPDLEALRRGELAAALLDSARLAGEADKALGVDPLPLPQGAPPKLLASTPSQLQAHSAFPSATRTVYCPST